MLTDFLTPELANANFMGQRRRTGRLRKCRVRGGRPLSELTGPYPETPPTLEPQYPPPGAAAHIFLFFRARTLEIFTIPEYNVIM